MRRILVRLPNWLGDLLLARPLLHALRNSHPDVEVCGVAPEPLLRLIERDQALARREPWPTESAARAALIRRLRAWHPEAALVLPPSFSSALLAFRCGAPVRVGYAHDLRGFLLNRRPTHGPRGDAHLSEEYLALGRVLGATGTETPVLDIPQVAADAVGALLAAAAADRDRFVILGPGALYGPAKRWPAERFVELGRRVAGRGLKVLVCGTSAESETCGDVAAAIGAGAVSLAGRTELVVLAGLCARAAVAVCNDSGLAHLAAAVGTPTVVLFGSTSSAWSAPLGPRVRVVQHGPVCSPCFKRTCSIGYRCLQAIEVSEVDRACREIAA